MYKNKHSLNFKSITSGDKYLMKTISVCLYQPGGTPTSREITLVRLITNYIEYYTCKIMIIVCGTQLQL